MHDVCTEIEIKSIADAMVTNGMQDAGYVWIILDDCWGATHRSVTGGIAADVRRFPSGNGTMAELATWLHSRGFKLGLYMTAGNETCALGNRHIPGEPHARGIPGSCAAGPPTATSCRQQYERDTRDVASWGSDFVKLDWCRFNGTASSEESLTTAFGAALNATGRNIFFNFHCGASWAPWCPRAGAAAVSWRIGTDHHDTWDGGHGTAGIVDVLGQVANRSGPYRYSDPDFMMTGGAGCDDEVYKPGIRCPGQTDVEYRTEISLWSIAAAPMVVATDVRLLSPFMAAVLLQPEVIAISQDPLVASRGAILTSACNTSTRSAHAGGTSRALGGGGSGTCQIWARVLTPGADGGRSVAVALYNGGDVGIATLAIPLALLFDTLAPPATLAIRDVWERRDLGTYSATDTYRRSVDSHATEVLVVRELKA